MKRVRHAGVTPVEGPVAAISDEDVSVVQVVMLDVSEMP